MSKEERNIELARLACSHLEARFVESQSRREGFGPLDYSHFLGLLADDVVFHVPCPANTPFYGGEFNGKSAVVKLFLEDDAEIVADLRVERRPEYVATGDRVVVLTAYSYTITKTNALAENKEIALVLDFRDGLIQRAVEIQDMSEWSLAYSERVS